MKIKEYNYILIHIFNDLVAVPLFFITKNLAVQEMKKEFDLVKKSVDVSLIHLCEKTEDNAIIKYGKDNKQIWKIYKI